MGILQRDVEQQAMELADELALKRTGLEFNDLPTNMQYSLFSEAEQHIREQMQETVENWCEGQRETALMRE